MNLTLKFEKDCSVPVAWCEVCNTEITDAGMAMVYWRAEAYRGGLHAPLLTHKRCMSARRSMDTHRSLVNTEETIAAQSGADRGETGRYSGKAQMGTHRTWPTGTKPSLASRSRNEAKSTPYETRQKAGGL